MNRTNADKAQKERAAMSRNEQIIFNRHVAASIQERTEIMREAMDQAAQDQADAGVLLEQLRSQTSTTPDKSIFDPRAKEFAGAAITSVVDTTMSIGDKLQIKKGLSEGWDNFWAGIQKMGDDTLKPLQNKMKLAPWLIGILSFPVGVGVFFAHKFLLKPSEKTLEEKNKEWDKKWEGIQKKIKDEADRKAKEEKRDKKLEEAGLTNDLITAIRGEVTASTEGVVGSETKTPHTEEKPKEEKAA